MSSRRPVRERKDGAFKKDVVDWNHIELGSESEDDDRPVKRAKGASAPEQELTTEQKLQLEAETAWAVGFNALAISDNEEGLLPTGANEAAYVQMRNHVLAMWRADVSRFLTEDEAASSVEPLFQPYARLAWRFLTVNGYINFGVAPAIWERALATPDNRGTVIVIGAGMAGLACARQLRAFGFKVMLLEGHDRPGGRVYTKKMEGKGVAAVGDLGGSILTGIDGNPLAVLCTQLRIPQHSIDSQNVKLYMPDGRESDPVLDPLAEKRHNEILDKLSSMRDEMGDVAANISLGNAYKTLFTAMEPEAAALPRMIPQLDEADATVKVDTEQAGSVTTSRDAESNGDAAPPLDGGTKAAAQKRDLVNWHVANLEFANACEMDTLSMRWWDQDDPYELPGAHCFIPGGNIRLVAAMAEGLPILYNSVVREIRYSSKGVAVRTDLHEFAADAVVVTASLGVLKRDIINFVPPLPERKREAIKRVNFGVLNKLVLLFPRAFWGNCDMFGYVNEDPERRGDFFLFYSYAHLAGGPLLAALVSGKAALEYEEQSPKEAILRVMRILRRIYEPKGIIVPMPLQACCTRWGSDPLAFGSYSSLGVGSLGGEDYDVLAENLSGRVFFAGEATTKKYPATMHGAFHTGLREAANVSAAMAKFQLEAKAAAQEMANGVTRPGVVHNQELVRKAQEVMELSTRVAELFASAGFVPDVEFGCFACVYGPKGSGLEEKALLRIDIGNAQQGGNRKSLPIFLAISRQDVLMLQDTEGGDAARFTALVNIPGVKVVGRNHVDADVYRLILAILYPGRPVPSALPPHSTPASAAATSRASAPLPIAAPVSVPPVSVPPPAPSVAPPLQARVSQGLPVASSAAGERRPAQVQPHYRPILPKGPVLAPRPATRPAGAQAHTHGPWAVKTPVAQPAQAQAYQQGQGFRGQQQQPVRPPLASGSSLAFAAQAMRGGAEPIRPPPQPVQQHTPAHKPQFLQPPQQQMAAGSVHQGMGGVGGGKPALQALGQARGPYGPPQQQNAAVPPRPPSNAASFPCHPPSNAANPLGPPSSRSSFPSQPQQNPPPPLGPPRGAGAGPSQPQQAGGQAPGAVRGYLMQPVARPSAYSQPGYQQPQGLGAVPLGAHLHGQQAQAGRPHGGMQDRGFQPQGGRPPGGLHVQPAQLGGQPLATGGALPAQLRPQSGPYGGGGFPGHSGQMGYATQAPHPGQLQPPAPRGFNPAL